MLGCKNVIDVSLIIFSPPSKLFIYLCSLILMLKVGKWKMHWADRPFLLFLTVICIVFDMDVSLKCNSRQLLKL